MVCYSENLKPNWTFTISDLFGIVRKSWARRRTLYCACEIENYTGARVRACTYTHHFSFVCRLVVVRSVFFSSFFFSFFFRWVCVCVCVSSPFHTIITYSGYSEWREERLHIFVDICRRYEALWNPERIYLYRVHCLSHDDRFSFKHVADIEGLRETYTKSKTKTATMRVISLVVCDFVLLLSKVHFFFSFFLFLLCFVCRSDARAHTHIQAAETNSIFKEVPLNF